VESWRTFRLSGIWISNHTKSTFIIVNTDGQCTEDWGNDTPGITSKLPRRLVLACKVGQYSNGVPNLSCMCFQPFLIAPSRGCPSTPNELNGNTKDSSNVHVLSPEHMESYHHEKWSMVHVDSNLLGLLPVLPIHDLCKHLPKHSMRTTYPHDPRTYHNDVF
jgi:hypothetical protein